MALISNAIKPVFKNVINSIYDGVSRFVYNFDGVDDRGSLQFRAINPDGDIDIEFKTGSTLPAAGTSWTIVSQNIASTSANREFGLYTNNSNALQLLIGGVFSGNMGQPLEANTTYRVTLIGSSLIFYKNGAVILSTTFNRGSARESNAVTGIAARNTAATSWGSFYQGQIIDLKINGVLYPIADRNQSIQLPQPSGLGVELITPTVLENPASKGSQWTYLGGGRWQYVGNGTLNSLDFISGINQPDAGFVEFEVESYSGTGAMTCAQSNATGRFNSVGIKRYFFTTKGGSGGNTFQFKRSDSVPISCIIKNISFKPLLTTGASLVSNGDFAAVGTWVVGANSAITNGELQINVASSTVTRQPVATENTKDYLITYTVKSITSGAVRVLLYGNGTHYIGPDRTAAGTYTEIARFHTSGGSFTNSVNIQAGHTGAANVVVDNVSVLEITSLCNPLLLTNTTSDRWQEIVE